MTYLEGVHVAQSVLDVTVNDELGESQDRHGDTHTHTHGVGLDVTYLEGVHVAQSVLDVTVNDELGESQDRHGDTHTHTHTWSRVRCDIPGRRPRCPVCTGRDCQ